MSNTKIRDALAQATAYITAHPGEARYTDSPATAVLESGLAVMVQGPGGMSVRTDMPKSVGGGDASPSPGWLLRAAQASCLATLIAMRAAQQGTELGRIEVVVDSESDDRGILGLDDSVPAGPLSSRARVRIEGNLPAEQLVSIIRWAELHCPVQDAVSRAVPSTVEAAAAG
ncbi:MAG: OsmC family protein [Chloroflexi bacterium]|nr:MAG: OsmC family protein [Chloroflexota bacterium]